MDELARAAADQVGRQVPGEPLDRRRAPGDHAIGVGHRDDVGGGFDDRAEPPLAAAAAGPQVLFPVQAALVLADDADDAGQHQQVQHGRAGHEGDQVDGVLAERAGRRGDRPDQHGRAEQHHPPAAETRRCGRSRFAEPAHRRVQAGRAEGQVPAEPQQVGGAAAVEARLRAQGQEREVRGSGEDQAQHEQPQRAGPPARAQRQPQREHQQSQVAQRVRQVHQARRHRPAGVHHRRAYQQPHDHPDGADRDQRVEDHTRPGRGTVAPAHQHPQPDRDERVVGEIRRVDDRRRGYAAVPRVDEVPRDVGDGVARLPGGEQVPRQPRRRAVAPYPEQERGYHGGGNQVIADLLPQLRYQWITGQQQAARPGVQPPDPLHRGPIGRPPGPVEEI